MWSDGDWGLERYEYVRWGGAGRGNTEIQEGGQVCVRGACPALGKKIVFSCLISLINWIKHLRDLTHVGLLQFIFLLSSSHCKCLPSICNSPNSPTFYFHAGC